MRQRDLSQLLEECLQKLEAGFTLDQVLAEYPDQTGQLRSLLLLALAVKPAEKAARIPASAQIDSRRRFLNQAGQLNQRRGSAAFWMTLRFLKHNLASGIFALAAITMLAIALGSARALPGDRLYPMKLTAEELGSSMPDSASSPLEREVSSDRRRLSEVSQMIRSGRTGVIRFAGFLDHEDGSRWLVSGIPLILDKTQTETAVTLSSGYVEVLGKINPDGKVAVTDLQPRLVTLSGSLQAMDPGEWVVGDAIVRLSEFTQIDGSPQLASRVTIQAARTRDSQRFLAITVHVDTVVSQSTATPTPTPALTQLPTRTIKQPLPSAPTATAVTASDDKPESETPSDDHPTHEPEEEEKDSEEGEKSSGEDGYGGEN